MADDLFNSFMNGPDDKGRFGIFGGRFVSETLMPLILSLEEEYEKAKTDPEPLPESVEGLEGRAEAANLVGIYAALADQTTEQVLAEFGGEGFGKFKPALADLAVDKLAPVSERMRQFKADPGEVDKILADGAARANAIAEPIMEEVRRIVGFWKPA